MRFELHGRLYDVSVQHQGDYVRVTGKFYEKVRRKATWWERLISFWRFDSWNDPVDEDGMVAIDDWEYQYPTRIWNMVGDAGITTLWNEHGDVFTELAEAIRTNNSKLLLSLEHAKVMRAEEQEGPYR